MHSTVMMRGVERRMTISIENCMKIMTMMLMIMIIKLVMMMIMITKRMILQASRGIKFLIM